MMEVETGCLDILNVGSGHNQITFNKEDPIETDRAARMITDMLRRGYALFVEVGEGGQVVRVKEFDASRGVYIVADVPGVFKDELDPDWDRDVLRPRQEPAAAPPEEAPAPQEQRVKNGRRKKYREIPMAKARATAVGRTAGG